MTGVSTLDKGGILYAYDDNPDRLYLWGQTHGVTINMPMHTIDGQILWDTLCLGGKPPFKIAYYRLWDSKRERALEIMKTEAEK